jgi:hypothetical protein
METIKVISENRIDVGVEVPATINWTPLDKQEIMTEINNAKQQRDFYQGVIDSWQAKLDKFESKEVKTAIAEAISVKEVPVTLQEETI